MAGGLPLLPGKTLSGIAEAYAHGEVDLPKQLRDYLAGLNGLPGGQRVELSEAVLAVLGDGDGDGDGGSMLLPVPADELIDTRALTVYADPESIISGDWDELADMIEATIAGYLKDPDATALEPMTVEALLDGHLTYLLDNDKGRRLRRGWWPGWCRPTRKRRWR